MWAAAEDGGGWVIEHGSFRLETVLSHHIQITRTWGLEKGGDPPKKFSLKKIYVLFIYFTVSGQING